MVQPITDSVLDPEISLDELIGIRAATRLGIQIATNIGNTGTREVQFFNSSIMDDGTYSLSVDIENTGERLLNFIPYIELYCEFGQHIGGVRYPRRILYPETSIRLVLPLMDASPGRYRAQLILDCGGNDLFGALYSLTLK